ncbi:MAG: hypothetical protein RLZ55_1230 [Actinomycetota bacterium]|jgi:DNA-binding CsgD family transcriptional regulator
MDALEFGMGGSRQVVPLGESPFQIGRDPTNDLQLASDLTVSRNHAALEHTDLGWRVRDLQSSNGTFVNGIRVAASAPVHPGDVIEIGHTRLRLLVGQDADVVNPTDLVLDEPPGPHLTKREEEILRLVATGRTDAQIADQLIISVSTVRSHLERIRDKTGARRRAELTTLATALGLTD